MQIPALFRSACVAAVMAVAVSACGGKDNAPVNVARIVVTPASPTVVVDESVVLEAQTLDASGNVLTGRPVVWQSESAIIATVTQTGLLTGVASGSVGITARSEGKEARVTVAVVAPPLASITFSALASPLRVGRSQQLGYALLNTKGQQITGIPLIFTSSNPLAVSVDATGFLTGVAVGSATIRAVSGAVNAEAIIEVLGQQSPRITTIEPAVLVPNETVLVRGMDLRDEVNRSTTIVEIGGLPAPLLSESDTLLRVQVPCLLSGNAQLHATVVDSLLTRQVVIATPSLVLGPGAVADLPVAGAHCRQLNPTPGASRYLIMGYNTATSPNTGGSFSITGNPGTAAAAQVAPAAPAPRFTLAQIRDENFVRDTAHLNFLERERVLYQTLRSAPRDRALTLRRIVPLPALGDIRPIFYTFSGGCGDTTRVIQGRAIRVGTRAIIWEDTANTVKSTADANLASYYERMGRQFDDEQYDVIRKYFGDPLRRDAETDADGRLSMVFSQRLNGTGAAAYVTSCDQRTRATAAGSNVGEYFYGAVPTTSSLNLNTTASPDGWFYFMGRTVIHEVKHIASISARFANNASFFEQSWLEEGTARHAEELWVRDYVHRVPWKGNTGFGTASDNGLYCDFHPADATCAAADPLHRPTYGMRRQFNEIREKLVAPWDWSPFGNASSQSGGVFYQTAWSLVRYAIDRYAASDSAFFQTLTGSNLTGVTNLEAAAGASLDDMLGGWGLALFADDYPGLGSMADVAIHFPTWNLRNIYTGLSNSPNWTARWPTPFPIEPSQLNYGVFQRNSPAIRGGGHAYYELSGTAPGPQLINIQATPTVRIKMLRLQ